MLSVINFEVKFSEGNSNWLIELCSMLCTLFLLFSIYMRYDLWLRWKISLESLYTIHDTLTNTGIIKQIYFEQFLCLLAPYPFLDGITIAEEVKMLDTTINYEINHILLCMCFIRVYLLLRFTFYLSNFHNPRT